MIKWWWRHREAQYAVEPIVRTGSGERVGVELLAMHSQGWTNRRWRTWYERLPEIVERVRTAEHLVDSQYVAVNVDSDQLLDARINKSLQAQPKTTVIEWTERVPRAGASEQLLSRAASILSDLRGRLGLRLSFDDFGAGLDGYQRLSLLTPNFLKIDGRVLHRARADGRQMYLLDHMVDLAHNLRIEAVVEWVETAGDKALVLASGSEYAQGFLFGRREYTEGGQVIEKTPEYGVLPGIGRQWKG